MAPFRHHAPPQRGSSVCGYPFRGAKLKVKVTFRAEVYACRAAAAAAAPADLQVNQQAVARACHVVLATPVALLAANWLA